MTSGQRLAVIILAQVLFAAIVLLRFLVDGKVEGVLLLLTVPIALTAVATGPWGGLGAGLMALLVFGVWDGITGMGGGVMSYVARAVTFFLLGGLVGALANVPRDQPPEGGAEARGQMAT